jgi:hypothetical protein
MNFVTRILFFIGNYANTHRKYIMGAKIPSPIKVEVIKKWLQGKSRDQVASESHIGAGTVSNIIKESRKKDPEIDLLREVAVNLKKNALNIETFAPIVRRATNVRK